MKESWQPHGSLGGIVILLGQNLTNFGKKELVKNGMKHISWGRFWVLQALNEAPQNQASLCKKLDQKRNATNLLPLAIREGSSLHGVKL